MAFFFTFFSLYFRIFVRIIFAFFLGGYSKNIFVAFFRFIFAFFSLYFRFLFFAFFSLFVLLCFCFLLCFCMFICFYFAFFALFFTKKNYLMVGHVWLPSPNIILELDQCPCFQCSTLQRANKYLTPKHKTSASKAQDCNPHQSSKALVVTKKLLGTSATLVVTGALLVVTKKLTNKTASHLWPPLEALLRSGEDAPKSRAERSLDWFAREAGKDCRRSWALGFT